MDEQPKKHEERNPFAKIARSDTGPHGTLTFRGLLGLIGAIALVAAGVMMLRIQSQSTDSVFDLFFHAAGVFSIGMASIPLLLIGQGKKEE